MRRIAAEQQHHARCKLIVLRSDLQITCSLSLSPLTFHASGLNAGPFKIHSRFYVTAAQISAALGARSRWHASRFVSVTQSGGASLTSGMHEDIDYRASTREVKTHREKDGRHANRKHGPC